MKAHQSGFKVKNWDHPAFTYNHEDMISIFEQIGTLRAYNYLMNGYSL